MWVLRLKYKNKIIYTIDDKGTVQYKNGECFITDFKDNWWPHFLKVNYNPYSKNVNYEANRFGIVTHLDKIKDNWLITRMTYLDHLLKKNVMNNKKIRETQINGQFAWRVISQCGAACDDMGRYYDQNGQFIKANSWKVIDIDLCEECNKPVDPNKFIGMSIDIARKFYPNIRIVNQRSVTDDLRNNRLNVNVDDNNIITSIRGWF